MKHQAIYALHSDVVRIVEEETGFAAYDANDKLVSIDTTAVNNKATELLNSYNLEQLREERSRLLAETDWWDASDTAAMTDAQKAYRQALRDITKSATSLDDVTWPTKP
jgi:hypothetical protein